ncbi:unnamed protein product [Nezara viridula]|uniref:Uncharacterized protein n=1 Tax=Nezara viridula TaxID=85310 RepID=A0A9P0HJ35_NEZVI|nr:unnamed protein product [Nezara viridula]
MKLFMSDLERRKPGARCWNACSTIHRWTRSCLHCNVTWRNAVKWLQWSYQDLGAAALTAKSSLTCSDLLGLQQKLGTIISAIAIVIRMLAKRAVATMEIFVKNKEKKAGAVSFPMTITAAVEKKGCGTIVATIHTGG